MLLKQQMTVNSAGGHKITDALKHLSTPLSLKKSEFDLTPVILLLVDWWLVLIAVCFGKTAVNQWQ